MSIVARRTVPEMVPLTYWVLTGEQVEQVQCDCERWNRADSRFCEGCGHRLLSRERDN